MNARVLVLAPHPDDEVLGAGGSIARWAAEGSEVHVGIVTRGMPPMYSEGDTGLVRAEARAAHAELGVTKTHYLDLPAAALDTVLHAEVNAAVQALVDEITPEILLVPFLGDIHMDHQIVFHTALVAVRPSRPAYPQAVYAYETLSETNWNAPYLTPAFEPNTFVDITDYLESKLAAMACYASQVKPFPNERSIDSLRALAKLRGSTVLVAAAEAFVQVRRVV